MIGFDMTVTGDCLKQPMYKGAWSEGEYFLKHALKKGTPGPGGDLAGSVVDAQVATVDEIEKITGTIKDKEVQKLQYIDSKIDVHVRLGAAKFVIHFTGGKTGGQNGYAEFFRDVVARKSPALGTNVVWGLARALWDYHCHIGLCHARGCHRQKHVLRVEIDL